MRVPTINPFKNIIIYIVGGVGIYGSVINYNCSLEIWNVPLNDIELYMILETLAEGLTGI